MSSQQKAVAKLTVAALSATMLATTATMSLPALKADAKTSITQPTNTVKQSNTSRLGLIKTDKALIYKTPNASKGTKAGTSKLQLTYYIMKKAVYKNTTYYQISNYNSASKPVIGWLKSKDLTTKAYTITKNSTTPRYITGNGKGYTRPWGGSRNVLFPTLTASKGTLFKTKTTEKVGDETWYSGTLFGQTIWLKSNQLTTKKPATTTVKPVVKTVNRLGRIKTATAKVYPDINNLKSLAQATSTKLDKTYYITKQATIGKSTYYQLSTSATAITGWVLSTDLTTVAQTTTQRPSTYQDLNVTGAGYIIPWGSSKDIVVKTLSKDQKFTIETATKAGNETWYQGTTSDNKTIWVSSTQVTESEVEPTNPDQTNPEPPKEEKPAEIATTPTTKVGTLKSTTTKIYQDLTDLTKTIDAGTAYTKENFYVNKQATVDNKTYYEISRTNGTKTTAVGWIDKDQINLSDITSSTATNLKLYLTGFGTAYNISNGTTNNVVYSSLADYRTKAFTTNKIEIINGKTYYQGSIGGKTVWISPEQTGNDYLVENLRKTSNITQSEMEAYLIKKKGTSITSNNLYKMIPTFLEVQKEYGINAQFMLAHAIWETGWGSSTISQYKNNFFGYQAYDSAPFTCALYFPTGKEGLEYYADRIYYNYLKDGGQYNNGISIAGMNVRYATDTNWGRSIARLMDEMKPYDSKYYSGKTISTLNPAPVTVKYNNIIPADKPQPSVFYTFDKGITATTTMTTPVYGMPYSSSKAIGSLPIGQEITILGHNSDIKDYKDKNGKLLGRWFRVSYKGADGKINDQAWVRSDYLNIYNLLVTNGDGCNVRDKATTTGSKILTKLNSNAYMKLVTDSTDKVVTTKDESNATWYQIYIPGTTTKAWISSTIVTKF